MGQRKIIATTCFVIGLTLIALRPLQAQIPPEFIGIWAEDACETSEPAIITGPTLAGLEDGLLIVFDDDKISTYVLKSRPVGDNWFEISMNDGSDPSFFKRQANRLFRVRERPRPISGDGPPPSLDPTNSALLCNSAPPRWQIPHGEVIEFLLSQQALEASCDGSDLARCLGALMEMADVSGDGELSSAEISRAARIFVHFTSLIAVGDEGESEIDESEVLKAVAGASVAGPALARILALSFDYDNSGGLSLAELAQDRQFDQVIAYEPQVLIEVGGLFEDGLEGLSDLLEGLFEAIANRN